MAPQMEPKTAEALNMAIRHLNWYQQCMTAGDNAGALFHWQNFLGFIKEHVRLAEGR